MGNRYTVTLTPSYHSDLLGMLSYMPPKLRPARLLELAEHGARVLRELEALTDLPTDRARSAPSPGKSQPTEAAAQQRFVVTLDPTYHPTLIAALRTKPPHLRRYWILYAADRAAAAEHDLWCSRRSQLDPVTPAFHDMVQQLSEIVGRLGGAPLAGGPPNNSVSGSDAGRVPPEEGERFLPEDVEAAVASMDLGAMFNSDRKKSRRNH